MMLLRAQLFDRLARVDVFPAWHTWVHWHVEGQINVVPCPWLHTWYEPKWTAGAG